MISSSQPTDTRPIHLLKSQEHVEQSIDSLALIAPQPPRLSKHLLELENIEERGIYSNYGPVNTGFEEQLIERVFLEGSCVTVCNATIGLMLSIREVIGEDRAPHCKYALMPSFTFAATAQAAIWCGLIPLFCDIDPNTWMADPQSEQALLHTYAGQIAVVVPYATFGNNLDLARYDRLSEEHGVPIVVDAAASLGSLCVRGRAFGAGFRWPVVFSMHATKVFAVGEGGFIYCADAERIARLRCMGNFGFVQNRSALCIGMNSKMSEVAALTATLQLRNHEHVSLCREELATRYAAKLGPAFLLQQQVGVRQVRSFQSVLLPAELAGVRGNVIELLSREGVGAGSYFSPHLAEQPYFVRKGVSCPLPCTADIASRVLSLPLRSDMTCDQVDQVIAALHRVTQYLTSEAGAQTQRVASSQPTVSQSIDTVRAA